MKNAIGKCIKERCNLNNPLIPGGYILLSRKITESEIFKKPPLYLKVWVYLLSCAQHRQYKGLKKGQLYISIPEIQEACSHMVGYRKVTPTKAQIYNVLEWLRKRCEGYDESNDNTTMITTTKATHGLLVNIEKYGFYQNPKNYESNGDNDNEKNAKAEREQRQPDNINKNVKNDKNVKKETYSEIAELYNTICLSFPRLTKLSDARKKAIKTRLNIYTTDDFKKLFTMAESSDFLKGKNDRNWSATFDWLIKDSNMAKVLDGNYKNSKQADKKPKSTNKFNNFPQREYTSQQMSDIERALINKGLED